MTNVLKTYHIMTKYNHLLKVQSLEFTTNDNKTYQSFYITLLNNNKEYKLHESTKGLYFNYLNDRIYLNNPIKTEYI